LVASLSVMGSALLHATNAFTSRHSLRRATVALTIFTSFNVCHLGTAAPHHKSYHNLAVATCEQIPLHNKYHHAAEIPLVHPRPSLPSSSEDSGQSSSSAYPSRPPGPCNTQQAHRRFQDVLRGRTVPSLAGAVDRLLHAGADGI
jgi:hypothetical protein